MAIFNHQYGLEPNVDHMEVLAPKGRNILRFLQQSPGDSRGDVKTECTLPRAEVEKLYNALGEWLYPTGTPKLPDLTGITEAVSKALESMAVAVQSLHLTTLATVKVPEPEPLCARTRPPGWHPATRCTFCGHLWTEHPPTPTEPEHHGRLMSVLPRRTRRCIECGHQASDHHVPTQGWDGGCLCCSCTWGGPQ